MSKAIHNIDGRFMTVDEIAEMLHVSVRALEVRRSKYGGCSYQLIVDMYRDNLIGSRTDKWERHMVDGEWITLEQAAERVGVKPKTLRAWRSQNRDEHGIKPTLAEAVAHYRKYITGERKRYPGSIAKRYWVKGEYLTFKEAAERYHTTENALRSCTHKHNCSLNAAIKRLESRRTREAEKNILAILIGEA